MHKFLTLFLVTLFFSPLTFAKYDIIFENDTPHQLEIKTGTLSDISPKYFGGEEQISIQPYGRKKVQWFNFDKGIKFGKSYTFYVEVNKKGENLKPITYLATIKGFLVGSSIQSVKVRTPNGEQTLFDKEPNPLFSVERFTQVHGGLMAHDELELIVDAIKFSVPNPHYNLQLTDALSYVISEKQKQFHAVDQANKLSMISYNVQVWPVYATAGGIILNKPGQRVKNIALKTKNYDVASFQEVFDKDHRNSLISAMRDKMPYHAGPQSDKRPLSSGVIVFSHWPILESKGYIYKKCTDIDCGASKGITYVKIDKLGKPYHIFSTHFQAGSKDGIVKARKVQINEMRQFIDAQSIPANEPVIINGDLNIDAMAKPESTEHKEFMGMLKTLDAKYRVNSNYAVLPYTINGKINWMSGNHDTKVLDYILTMNQHQQPSAYESRVLILRGEKDKEMFTGTPYGDTELSDHFSIEAELTF